MLPIIQLRYHIIDAPGVLENNVLDGYNYSYYWNRLSCLDDLRYPHPAEKNSVLTIFTAIIWISNYNTYIYGILP